MAHLTLSLLGPFQVMLAGQPVTGFKSNKVRALLAYLAVDAARPHRREVLAGLLWPDWPDRDALSNLRYSLSNLRRMIGDRQAEPPFLQISRDMLQFNPAGDYWLDVTAFSEGVAGEAAVEPLEEAVGLYRGSFLEGFTVADSPAFEEWVLLTREELGRQMLLALERLAEAYEGRGRYSEAESWVRRRLELEPWDEGAQRQLMRLLALQERRSAALAQYETCCRLLADELGVEPAAETTRLYAQIRSGELKAGKPVRVAVPDQSRIPRFLEGEGPVVEAPVFVARETELAQLDGLLGPALAGQGRVAFVTGEAGSGKTALLEAFSRRAQAANPELVVAVGNCNAYTGLGDPYLPFRETLELLAGDVEARWAAGALSREHARRLWDTLPVTGQALVENGPDLVDTFVRRAALLERVAGFASNGMAWQSRLAELVARKPVAGLDGLSPQQSDLFEQYTRVLQGVAQARPLLLLLDDLQWADLGSISLLFHLGRHLAGSRILVVGAYRSEEVAIGRGGERHALEPVINEFQRAFGASSVDLGQAAGRGFVTALLDCEPNRLGPSFREMLYRQTQGHPLFTIELLRGLQERGDLAQDEEGCWIEGPALNWEAIPARVEAVVAERIGRLARPLRAALRVASVEGELFTAEVIGRVRSIDGEELLASLSRELDRRHRLVRAESIVRVDGQLLSRYRFRHILFQKYLYGSLDEVERVHLHERVGTALEGLYGSEEQLATIAVQLALHFQKAQNTDKAVHYLQQAGDRALRLSAYREAITHLTRGIELLATLPDSPDWTRRELAMQLLLGLAWMDTVTAEKEKAYTRAHELCRQIGQPSELCRVLGEMAVLYYARAEYPTARELAEEALDLAQQAGDPLLVAAVHWCLGFILFGLGEYTAARTHLEQTIAFYDPHQHHRSFIFLHSGDAGVSALAYDACCLWCLGYPDQALSRSQEALALARELDHAFSLADVLCYGGCLFNAMRQDAPRLKEYAEEMIQVAQNIGFKTWRATGVCYRSEALAMLGRLEEGLAQMRTGMAVRESRGTRCHSTGLLCALAKTLAQAGRLPEALVTVADALALVDWTDERHWEAELYRLQGELLLDQGDEAAAEVSLQQALAVARRQQAKMWELRAVTSLSRLWQRQGKPDEARQLLSGVYDWFSEGFDTPDLVEARALLDQLSG